MDLSRENTLLTQKRCAEPYSYNKRPRSLYKNHQKHHKLSIDTFNLNQLDLLADSSNIYHQREFARATDMDTDLIDADRDSIISLENDTFQIIRPASFAVNKPKALYRNKDSQSKFSVNNAQVGEKIEQLDVEICQPIQFSQIETKPDNQPILEKNASLKKVKTNNQATQTKEKLVKNATTETDKVVEREKNASNLVKVDVEKSKTAFKETKNDSKDETRSFNEDTKSVEFDDKDKLIEKKLKLFYPFKIAITLSIFLFLSSLVQIVLQLVLIVNETPLKTVSAGVWSGFVGLLVFFSNIVIIIKRKFCFFVLSIISNCIGIFVFIALAVINSICIKEYETCSSCSNLIGVNIALMVLAVISFSACFVFLIKIKIEIY